MDLGVITTLRAVVTEVTPQTVIRLDSGDTLSLPQPLGLAPGSQLFLQVLTPDQVKSTNQDIARSFLKAIITAS